MKNQIEIKKELTANERREKARDRIESLTIEDLDGATVLAKGFTMLSKVNGGKRYRLARFDSKIYGPCFTFYPARGKNPVVHHLAYSVLSSVQCGMLGYLNGLELA